MAGQGGAGCAPGAKAIDGGCFFLMQDMPRAHDAAAAQCAQVIPTAHLAQFASMMEQTDVMSMNGLAPGLSSYWFELACAAKDMTCSQNPMTAWDWPGSGAPTYFDWEMGYPNSTSGCARLRPFMNGFGWADASCDKTYFAVCQLD
jgi:hypothetical protein